MENIQEQTSMENIQPQNIITLTSEQNIVPSGRTSIKLPTKLPQPKFINKVKSASIWQFDERVYVRSVYDKNLVRAFKIQPNFSYDTIHREWSFPINRKDVIILLLLRSNFTVKVTNHHKMDKLKEREITKMDSQLDLEQAHREGRLIFDEDKDQTVQPDAIQIYQEL